MTTHLPGLHPSRMFVRYRKMRSGSDPPSPANAVGSPRMSCVARPFFATQVPDPRRPEK